MHHLRTRAAIALVAIVACGAAAGLASAASSPSVSTGSHKSVTQTSAVLLGTVNPNGSATSWQFQWGLTSAYGSIGHIHSAGSGTTTLKVSVQPKGLIPGTIYHYRIVAVNRFGATNGRDRTFTTTGPPPPAVATGPAILPAQYAVTLTGIINPNGATTGWRFQYGETSAYGTYTTGGTVPSGKAPVVVTERLTGLAPGTFFHYRLVAFHGTVATNAGADQVFYTEPSPRPMPTLTVHTTPRHSAHAPFVFTTTGKVTGPSYIPGSDACTGFVAVRFFLGGRGVSYVLAALQPDCTYSAQTVFGRLPGRGPHGRVVALHIAVRFRGNGYLELGRTAVRAGDAPVESLAKRVGHAEV